MGEHEPCDCDDTAGQLSLGDGARVRDALFEKVGWFQRRPVQASAPAFPRGHPTGEIETGEVIAVELRDREGPVLARQAVVSPGFSARVGTRIVTLPAGTASVRGDRWVPKRWSDDARSLKEVDAVQGPWMDLLGAWGALPGVLIERGALHVIRCGRGDRIGLGPGRIVAHGSHSLRESPDTWSLRPKGRLQIRVE